LFFTMCAFTPANASAPEGSGTDLVSITRSAGNIAQLATAHPRRHL
jgi:hypothetical protein